MDNDLTQLAVVTVLPKIDALPAAQGEPAIDNWYGKTGGSQRRFYMGRHIILSFQRVAKKSVIGWHQAVYPVF